MTDNIKILILEDNPSDVSLLLHELKKNGVVFNYRIVEAREAFEHELEAFRPDIILSDYNLPAFDGLSAFNIKKAKYPDIPFIIVTGTLGDEKAVELIKSGVTDYALKDKLFTLNPKISRALRDTEEMHKKRTADEELKMQYAKLHHIAMMQSHQVRLPVANILGLYNLFNFDDPCDPVNADVLQMLKISAELLDKIIYEIVQKTSEVIEPVEVVH